MRFTLSDSYPYRNYSVTFGFLPFLELNGRLTEMRDSKSADPEWENYGYGKDKAADFKVLLFNEKKFLPAIAAGVLDFHGTQIYFSEYIVASKKIGDFDFTLGYGGNLFGDVFKEEETDVRELDGFFGGIEWKIFDNFSLMLEYDPTSELAVGRGDVSSRYNYGIQWQPWRWLTCGYSYQRGEEHSFLIAITYPFGKTLTPQKPDEPFYGPVNWTPLKQTVPEKTISERLRIIQGYLAGERFKNTRVTISDNLKTLYIDFENREYLSHSKALGRVLRVAAAQTPSDVENICITLKQKGIAMVELMVPREDYIGYLNGDITDEEIMAKTEITTEITEKSVWWGKGYETVHEKLPSFTCIFEPVKLDAFLNDPSGFFRFRAGPAISLKQEFASGASVESYVKIPLYSDVKTNREPISDMPVRSDVHEYLSNTGISVETLFANRFFKFGANDYLKLGGGYLELQYAGVTAEYLRTFGEGKFAMGKEITWAKKRDPDSVLGLYDSPPACTFFYNIYAYAPGLDTTFSAKIGKFLGGDSGVRLQATRDIRGGKVFLWYTKTDTSGFTGENRNYSDKGAGFAIPIRVFEDADRGGHYTMSLSPWSRDTGQPVNQPYSLFDFVREFTPAYILNHWKELKE